MITYALAKKIKDAGFPQIGSGKYIDADTGKDIGLNSPMNMLYIPTLEEAIEACNTEFLDLNKLKDGWGVTDHYSRKTGKIPLEAVLNLWLKLDKK